MFLNPNLSRSYQKLRILHDGLREVEALSHAEGILPDGFLHVGVKAHEGHDLSYPLIVYISFYIGQKLQVLIARIVAYEARCLDYDTGVGRVVSILAYGLAEHLYTSAVAVHEAEYALHEHGLAGAIAADKAVDLALLTLDAHVVETLERGRLLQRNCIFLVQSTKNRAGRFIPFLLDFCTC